MKYHTSIPHFHKLPFDLGVHTNYNPVQKPKQAWPALYTIQRRQLLLMLMRIDTTARQVAIVVYIVTAITRPRFSVTISHHASATFWRRIGFV